MSAAVFCTVFIIIIAGLASRIKKKNDLFS